MPSLIGAALALAACGTTNYAYVPEGAKLAATGAPTTRVAIPPEQPKGEVRVESRGLTQLAAPGGGTVDAIHVRLTVSNNSDERPWRIDTREQLLEIRGEGQSRPLFANSDREGMPLVTVGRRQQRAIDLFYPLPTTVTDAEDLQGFELLWQVNTGSRAVAERTPFGRVSLEPTYYTTAYAGWGPFWWHDPYYSGHAFLHYRPMIYHAPSRISTRAPGRQIIRDHRRTR